MSDRIDVQPLSAASAERLDRLFRLYSRQVLAYAVTRAKRPEDAHDIAGATWVKACRSITRLRADDAHAMPWLASAVRTVAIDFYRPKRASEQPQDWTDVLSSFALPTVPPADDSLYALAELTAPQAVAVKLAAQGLSHGRIASRLGKTRQAVQQNINGGARRLRTSMADNPPLPVRKPGATNPPKPRAAHSRAPLALAR